MGICFYIALHKIIKKERKNITLVFKIYPVGISYFCRLDIHALWDSLILKQRSNAI